ncbi:MAG TPA: adenylate/guanylate cyclase domain-containing protein, partial [Caldimonas sp.]
MPCTRCDADNPPGARFCGACGASLEAACAHCGSVLLAGQRFCTGCGADVAGPAKAAPDDGERRHATVMFSDLSGYTALNETLDPEEVEAIMGRIKAEATAVIESHGGTVNQFVGDEIMALFGVPLARRDDPRRAVRAALELHRVVDRLVAGLKPGHGAALTMHTGINTGLVVARRSDARAGDYALTGDTVNTAARLRSLATPGEIVVSAETWQQVSEYFEAEAGAPVEVKGKERPLVPYRIRTERAAPASGDAALVG